MPLLMFCDSWDHYDTIIDKWTAAGTDCVIDATGTKSRTGIGCLLIRSAAFGPIKSFPNSTKLSAGTAFYTEAFGGTGEIFRFIYQPSGAQNVHICVLGSGAIQASVGNFGGVGVTILGTSVTTPFQFSSYNYIEAQVNIAAAPNGSVVVRCNGVECLNITGVKTYAEVIDGGQPFVNQLELMGPGGILDIRHDDTYIKDWTDSPSAPFYGAIRIYAQVPTADSSPLEFTPSSGVTHYNLVDEIPPNEATDYVSDGTIGQQDQYVYTTSGIPAASSIPAVQHVLDAKLDSAGSRSIASSFDGAAAATSNALTVDYKMYTTPYDANPSTGLPWEVSDFPAPFGPAISA